MNKIKNLLEIQNVTKIFSGSLLRQEELIAVDDLSLILPADKPLTMTIAGESGSGKTTLALMVLNFLTPDSGRILYKGIDIKNLTGQGLMKYRREVQAVFQDPYETFNPFYKIDHVFRMVIDNFKLEKSKREAKQITAEALEIVGLNPEEILGKYPHQLSGGQLQRVMVSRALMLKPQLIVADEPVSMIDVSLRATVLDVLTRIKDEFGISLLYVTHDLSTALQISDEIIILYRGTTVEKGDAEAVIKNPQHPYTQLLMSSIPLPDPTQKWELLDPMVMTKKVITNLVGCRFYDRCRFRMEICLKTNPPLYNVAQHQSAACYIYQDKESSGSDNPI